MGKEEINPPPSFPNNRFIHYSILKNYQRMPLIIMSCTIFWALESSINTLCKMYICSAPGTNRRNRCQFFSCNWCLTFVEVIWALVVSIWPLRIAHSPVFMRTVLEEQQATLTDRCLGITTCTIVPHARYTHHI